MSLPARAGREPPIRDDFSTSERCAICGYPAPWTVYGRLRLCRLHVDLLAAAIRAGVHLR